jgi:4-hydroxybenzoate polyprenyltransferase
VAVVAAVPLSLALGYRAGAAALLIIVCGWLYNLGLKASWWSWLPYALAFGALPAVATLARADHPWPAAWAMAAGALLGVSAHFANVLPDLRADAATGVRGLPHRMGARASVIAGPVLLLAATAAIVFGASGGIGVARWATLAVAVVVAAVAVTAGLSDRGSRAASRTYFLATVLVAVADIVLFAVSGGRLF